MTANINVNDDYAIVIGINSYTALRPLSSAVRDASRFMEWLLKPDGGNLDSSRVIIIPGDTPDRDWLNARPNADSIRAKLYEMGINRGRRIGRRLYIYFSGHGFTDNANDVSMAMANAGMGFFGNSVSFNSLHNFFSQVGYFDEVVYILDCCREQTKYNFTPQQIVDVKYFKDIFVTNNAAAAPVSRFRDLSVMATGYGERSYAPTVRDIGERRGILTRALIEGLEGRAALADGSITAGSLRAFIEQRVREIAGESNLPQEAQINDSNSGGIIFKAAVVQPAPPKIKVRIKIDKAVNASVTVFDKGTQHIRSLGEIKTDNYIWEIELEKRLNPPYMIFTENPNFSATFDLGNANEEETYDFSFSQS